MKKHGHDNPYYTKNWCESKDNFGCMYFILRNFNKNACQSVTSSPKRVAEEAPVMRMLTYSPM